MTCGIGGCASSFHIYDSYKRYLHRTHKDIIVQRASGATEHERSDRMEQDAQGPSASPSSDEPDVDKKNLRRDGREV